MHNGFLDLADGITNLSPKSLQALLFYDSESYSMIELRFICSVFIRQFEKTGDSSEV